MHSRQPRLPASPRHVGARRFCLAVVATALTATLPATGAAEPTPTPAARPTRRAVRYLVDVAGTSVQAGGAKVPVKAPMATVIETVTQFRAYSERISKFRNVRVLGRKGQSTDVYLEVPILKGLGKIWAIVRFEAPKARGKHQVTVRGTMVQGNVERLDAEWLITSLSETDTQLNLELLVMPKLPVPGSLVAGESAYAADVAVVSLRDHAEQVAQQPR